jgi:hypothetical protein
MFPTLPDELEIKILRKYFELFIVGHLNSKERVLRTEFRQTVLPKVIEYSIMEKAGRIINEIIDIDNTVLNNQDNLARLDQMFYSLVNIHRSGQVDLFNF